uniref:Universal stress protein n=1 Tax=Angiostrongylus cantonensis TaxID=6313 RepID=A0A0K0D0V6_ANGCA
MKGRHDFILVRTSTIANISVHLAPSVTVRKSL